MEILVHHRIRILNTISQAMKSHLESTENLSLVVVSGFFKDKYADEPAFAAEIFDNTENTAICIENFKLNDPTKEIVSVHLIKEQKILAENDYPVTKLDARININGNEFEV